MAFSLGTSDTIVTQYEVALQKVRGDGTYDAIMKKNGQLKPNTSSSKAGRAALILCRC